MNQKLSKNDIVHIKEKLSSAEIRYLHIMRNQKFSVGDVLIKKMISLNEDGTISQESFHTYDNSFLNRRYLIVHVDENTNAAFYKEVNENGKLDNDLGCTIDFDDVGYNDMSYFEVDPSFVDAVIFGEEFDLSSLLKEEKERKARLIKMNRSTAVTFDNLKDINNFIESLNPNDTIYYHSDDKETFNNNDFVSFKLKKPRKAKLSTYTETRSGRRVLSKHKATKALNDTHVLYLRCLQHNNLITTCDLINQAIYKTKPIVLKDQP